MAKYSGINRPYEIKGEDKSPAERQRELDEKMKKLLWDEERRGCFFIE